MSGRWRVGRKVGRTIYAQVGEEPSDDDVLIGVMDTPDLAARAVAAVNGDAVCREPGCSRPWDQSQGRWCSCCADYASTCANDHCVGCGSAT